MKNTIARLLLAIVVVAGISSNAVANARSKLSEPNFKSAGQSLRDTTVFHRKFIRIKGMFLYLMSPLMAPWDIDGPGGGNPDKKR